MIRHSLGVFLATVLLLALGSPARAMEPLVTAFTYQGEIFQNAVPASGSFDLRFRLYSASAGGLQVGPELCLDNVVVTNGRFKASLDFGAAFTGQRGFLEVDVRQDTGADCSNLTGYVSLAPRQELTAVPNAQFAVAAGSATTSGTAANAASLNGQSASFYLNASNLTGTLSDARLSNNVATLNGNQTFTGLTNFTNLNNTFSGIFTGNGAAINNLNGANVQAGTLTRSRVAPDIESVLAQWNQTPGQPVRQPLDAVGWGLNTSGQTTVPALPPGVTYTQVAAGSAHSLALRSDGTVVAWGANGNGQTTVPALPPGVTYTQVGVGGNHSLALRSDGNLVAWGLNAGGQTLVPTLPPGVTYRQVDAGDDDSLAVRSDGTVVGWGFNGSGQTTVPALPPGVTYIQVAAGRDHSLALRSDGTVVGWGSNGNGQATVPALPPGVTFTQVAAGSYHSLALRSDGTVVGWGNNAFGQTTVPALPPGVTYTQVAARDNHTLALRSDGAVVGWGYNGTGQTTVPALPQGVTYTQVSAGYNHGLALRQQAVTPSILNNSLGISVGSAIPPPPAGGIAAQSSIAVDGGAANSGTLDGSLRFGNLANGVGIASKQTSSGNQNGLDFFTGGSSRLNISSNGNVGVGLTGPATSGKFVVLTDSANIPTSNSSSAIRARHDGSSAAPDNPFAIFGQTRGGSGFLPTGGAAIFGSSDANHGTVGFTSGTDGAYAIGARGSSLADTGTGIGVYGSADGDNGIGVKAVANSTSAVGVSYGLYARAASPIGIALRAENIAATGEGLALYASNVSTGPVARFSGLGGLEVTGIGPGMRARLKGTGTAPALELVGTSGHAWTVSSEGTDNLDFAPSLLGAPAASITSTGGFGIGTTSPLSTLHIRNSSSVGLTTASLENDDLIVEALDAALGLYSTGGGIWGSAISLKEVNSGTLVNTWGIARQTSGGDGSLRFTFGTDKNYATNPAMLTLSTAGNATVTGSVTAASFSGSGAGLTALNAANLTTGVLSNSRLSGTYSLAVNLTNASNTLAGTGAGLTALNASNLASGTVADARLSSNIPRLNAPTSAFTGNVSATGTVQSTGGFVFPDSTTQTTAVSPIISAAVSVDPPNLASLAGATLTVTVAGAAVGDAVVANPGANLTTGYLLSYARVSAADTIVLGFYNGTAGAVNPNASTWQFRVMK